MSAPVLDVDRRDRRDWGWFGRCVECGEHPGIGPMGLCGKCFWDRFESDDAERERYP